MMQESEIITMSVRILGCNCALFALLIASYSVFLILNFNTFLYFTFPNIDRKYAQNDI